MTALVAFTTPDPAADRVARRMLAAAPQLGGDRVAVETVGGAAVGAARAAWQAVPGLGGRTLVARRDGVLVAADAALCYRDDLRAAIAAAGVRPDDDDDPAALIAAAYLAWGTECAARLDGDFAFVVWDEPRRRLVAARDWVGRRTLYHARLADGATAVASAAGSLLAHPGCARGLDLRAVGATAAGFLGAVPESAYAAVRAVPAGHTLVCDAAGEPRLAPHWEPPVFEQAGRSGRTGFDDAAAELRALLGRAVLERMAPTRPTAVWMSGGWDSPPVFAAGRAALAERGDPRPLLPVSVSYPEGDPGREDETIASIAAHWQVEPAWVDSRRVPLFGAPEAAAERAAERDQPLAHVFELWNRALVDRSRAVGAAVALDGIGGDALFQVSPVFLADLLARGRLGELRREWRHVDPGGSPRRRARTFEQWAVRPALPDAVGALVTAVRGKPLAHHRQRAVPPWIDAAFARRAELATLGVPATRRRAGESRAALESRWYLDAGWGPAVLAATTAVGVAGGVELRSPYYDRRVVEFAARRPRAERRSLGETKRLVRAAVRGLLPDAVLAPRTTRTGTTAGYFVRTMRDELPALLAHLGDLALADAGVVDAAAFRAAADRFIANPRPHDEAGNLFFTLQTELWLRTHGGVAA